MRTQMGKNASAHVRDLYDWDKNVDLMEQIYIKMQEKKAKE